MIDFCGFFQFHEPAVQAETCQLLDRMAGSEFSPDASANMFFHGQLGVRIMDEAGHKEIKFSHATAVRGDMFVAVSGDIYNILDINPRLDGIQGTALRLLHLLSERGFAILEQLEGRFAILVYHLREKTLKLVRDKFGKSTLFYHVDEQGIMFGTRLACLARSDRFKRQINHTALAQYLQLTYLPAPLTMFDGVYKLMPATLLSVDVEGEMDCAAYWALDINQHQMLSDYEHAKTRLREVVHQSVARRMPLGGGVGTLLSGGIDSTIITAVLSNLSDRPIDTFTVSFDLKGFDESTVAASVARRYNTRHHVQLLDATAAMTTFERMMDSMDEPFADSSLLGSCFVAAFAKQHVNTVLTGDCGDELFAGYAKYLINYYSNIYSKLPRFIRQSILQPLISLMSIDSAFRKKAQKVIDSASFDLYDQRVHMMSLGFKRPQLHELLVQSDDVENSLDFMKPIYNQLKDQADEQTQAQFLDLNVVLEGDMFRKVGFASDMSSFSTRTPLIDTKVVELAYQMPSRYKISRRNQKIILKDAFIDLIPKEVLSAPKHGFYVPIQSWLREEFAQELRALTGGQFVEAQQLFDADVLTRYVTAHLNRTANWFSALWTVFVFQRWYKRWIQQA